MEQQTLIIIKIILLLFSAIGVIQFLFAFRAFAIELKEGLSLSLARITVITCTTVLLLLILFPFQQYSLKNSPNTGQREKQGERVDLSPNNPKKEEIQSKIAKIQQELGVLNEKKEKRQKELNRLQRQLNVRKPERSEPNDSYPKIDESILIVFLSALLVVTGTFALFIAGEPGNLVPESWLDFFQWKTKHQLRAAKRALKMLNRLAQCVNEENYEEGLDIAQHIDKDKLTKLNILDCLYLKSYCAIQILLSIWFDTQSESSYLSKKEEEELVSDVIDDLNLALSKAPRMVEAEYLLAWALVIKGEYEDALNKFKHSEGYLSSKEADFKYIKSYCLLQLARDLLTKADNERANTLFDEVISLEVLADKIPNILVENRLLNIRKQFNNRNFDEVKKELDTLGPIKKDLTPEQKKSIDVITESMEILILFTEKRIKQTLQKTIAFLEKWAPKELPDPDDHTADEYLFQVFEQEKLFLPPEIYRTFYFLQAITMIQLKSVQGESIKREEAEKIAKPLLKTLQFEPRNREALASLGALYFWFMPQKREKALEWMKAARNMGIESDYIYRLLERYQNIEIERKNILERFMNLSTRFFADTSVSTKLKKTLAEELSQFHEFRPILLDFGDIGEIEQRSPTIESLLNRAKYLQELSRDFLKSDINPSKEHFRAIYEEYQKLVKTIEHASAQLEELEGQTMEEIASQVLL